MVVPLHIEAVLPVLTVGVGFTTIVAVMLLPAQFVGPGPVGVIVNVTV